MVSIGIKFRPDKYGMMWKEISENQVIEPLKVYQVVIEFDRDVEREDVIVHSCKAVKEKYPFINIVYMEVSGRRVLVQFYDEYRPQVHPIAIALVITAIVGIIWWLTGGAEVVKKLCYVAEEVVEEGEEIIKEKPRIVREFTWVLILIAIAILVGAIGYTVSRAVVPLVYAYKRE